MTFAEGLAYLEANSVPDFLYVTAGEVGLAVESEGIEEREGVWYTYHVERGQKRGELAHPSEGAAVDTWVHRIDNMLFEYERRHLI